MIRIRTTSGPTSSTISLGSAAAIAGISALAAGLVIVPGQAATPRSKAISALIPGEVVPVRAVESVGEGRRAVRVVYPGPITAR